jgi:hypothetical protein
VVTRIPFVELLAGDELVLTTSGGNTLRFHIDEVHVQQDDKEPRSGLVVEPLQVEGSDDLKVGSASVLRFVEASGLSIGAAKKLSERANKSVIDEGDYCFLTQDGVTGRFAIAAVELRRTSSRKK